MSVTTMYVYAHLAIVASTSNVIVAID